MKANRFSKNDEGVSAVIGVILMVAITVILAAVIAAFVFGMVGGVSQKKSPAFTMKRDILAGSTTTPCIDVTYQDAGGVAALNTLTITSPTSGVAWNAQTGAGAASTVLGYSATAPTSATLTIGSMNQISGTSITSSPAHIVLTGSCDGTTQVVIDTTV